jgi:hypothetical protein
MPENETPTQNKPQGRTQRIEQFLLDPEKVIFESLEEFQVAVAELLDIFATVNIEELEKIQGQDGYTPKRGKDYFTEADLNSFEKYILDRMPKAGVDYPTRIEMIEGIRKQVAAIPRIKGDKGDDGEPGEKGKDGSPDTALDIVKKIRSLKNTNQGLKITDVRGLQNVLKDLIAGVDSIEELKKQFDNIKIVFPAVNGTEEGGGGEGGGLTEEQVEDIVNGLLVAGTGITATYDDASNTLTLALSGESFTTAMKAKVDFISVTQPVDLDQMEADIAALANGMVYKGDWNASGGVFPGAGAAQTGWFYYVSVAGTVDGVEFAVGDNIVAIVDNASAATYAANWSKHDQTDAVQAVAGLTGSITASALRSALNVEDGADVTDATNVAAVNAAAASKATPIDADSFPIVNSAASNAIGRVTFTNFKAFLKTYFDTLYQPLTTILNGLSAMGTGTGSVHQTAAGTFAKRTLTGTSNLITVTNGDGVSGNPTFTVGNLVVQTTATQTLTNKRINPRVVTIASGATITPNGDTSDQVIVTALAINTTIAAPTGTPVDGQKMIIRITSDATPRTISWNAIYRAIGITLPTTTVASKTFYVGLVYNALATKWDAIAYALEA